MFYKEDLKGKKILLHVCCGPCSLGAIEPLLDEGADITLYYYDPCIIEGEFEKRYEALCTVAEHYGLPLIVPEHRYQTYMETAGYRKDDEEGGQRCSLCIGERLRTTAIYAAENGYDAYTTTLTVSPHKNSKKIFALAESITESGVGVPFVKRDFKKRDGFKKSCRLTDELGIYRQRFCGCEYSAASAGYMVAEYTKKLKAEYAALEVISRTSW